MERVQKIIAQCGIASRRKAEDLIRQNKVTVNGRIIKIGTSADVQKDVICVEGVRIQPEKKVYIMLNKPRGFVVTVTEKHEMKTIMDIVKVPEKVFPVGRLDKESEGLLLMTNDGDFANKVMHPSFNVVKEYEVEGDRNFSERAVEMLLRGVTVEGRKSKMLSVKASENKAVVTIHEGRKHIVRKMCALVGVKVVRLRRTRIGKLVLDVPEGKYKIVPYSVVANALKQ